MRTVEMTIPVGGQVWIPAAHAGVSVLVDDVWRVRNVPDSVTDQEVCDKAKFVSFAPGVFVCDFAQLADGVIIHKPKLAQPVRQK